MLLLCAPTINTYIKLVLLVKNCCFCVCTSRVTYFKCKPVHVQKRERAWLQLFISSFLHNPSWVNVVLPWDCSSLKCTSFALKWDLSIKIVHVPFLKPSFRLRNAVFKDNAIMQKNSFKILLIQCYPNLKMGRYAIKQLSCKNTVSSILVPEEQRLNNTLIICWLWWFPQGKHWCNRPVQVLLPAAHGGSPSAHLQLSSWPAQHHPRLLSEDPRQSDHTHSEYH